MMDPQTFLENVISVHNTHSGFKWLNRDFYGLVFPLQCTDNQPSFVSFQQLCIQHITPREPINTPAGENIEVVCDLRTRLEDISITKYDDPIKTSPESNETSCETPPTDQSNCVANNPVDLTESNGASNISRTSKSDTGHVMYFNKNESKGDSDSGVGSSLSTNATADQGINSLNNDASIDKHRQDI